MKRALRNTLLAALLVPAALLAAERNDLSSCYDRSGLSEFKGPASGRQLVVVVDQTIPMPQDIQRAAWDKIGRFVQPGDQVKLYTFSAFVPGEYMRLITDVTLDTPPTAEQRDAMSMSKLRKLDTCLKGQNKAFVAGVGGLFVKALREAKSDLPKSEIEVIAKRYWTIVENEARQRRLRYVVQAFVWWFVPLIGLYALGWFVGWIYRGFRKQ